MWQQGSYNVPLWSEVYGMCLHRLLRCGGERCCCLAGRRLAERLERYLETISPLFGAELSPHHFIEAKVR